MHPRRAGVYSRRVSQRDAVACNATGSGCGLRYGTDTSVPTPSVGHGLRAVPPSPICGFPLPPSDEGGGCGNAADEGRDTALPIRRGVILSGVPSETRSTRLGSAYLTLQIFDLASGRYTCEAYAESDRVTRMGRSRMYLPRRGDRFAREPCAPHRRFTVCVTARHTGRALQKYKKTDGLHYCPSVFNASATLFLR